MLIVWPGWKCCKPRVLTFDEFLAIPPCATGKHSTVEEKPPLQKAPPVDEHDAPAPKPIAAQKPPTNSSTSLKVQPAATPVRTPSPAPQESESDDPSLPIPPNTTCRRKGCDTSSDASGEPVGNKEECIYHPGQPLFHEGSKGWTCCKRRVLEFDEFLKIQGCKRKTKHLFRGSKKPSENEEAVLNVR